MKLIAIPILMLLLITQIFSKCFVVLMFNMNRDYIAKNVCENRYRPKLNCKGNCILMKKMKQEDKNEQDVPGSIKLDISSSTISSRSFFAIAVLPVFNSSIPFERVYPWANQLTGLFLFFVLPLFKLVIIHLFP